MARKFADEGEQYRIVSISNWGTCQPQVRDIPCDVFLTEHNITAHRYTCSPKRSRDEAMTGLAYYRRLRGLKEREIADALGIRQYKWSLYETGDREPPVKVILQLCELLDATVDQLLATYASSEV